MDFLVVMECLFVVLTSMILSLKKKKKRAPSQGITITQKTKKYRDGFIIHKPEVLQNYIVL